MIVKDLAFAEEALAFPAPESTELEKLLVGSLQGDPRSNEVISKELKLRFEKLESSKDPELISCEIHGK